MWDLGPVYLAPEFLVFVILDLQLASLPNFFPLWSLKWTYSHQNPSVLQGYHSQEHPFNMRKWNQYLKGMGHLRLPSV